MRRLTLVLVPGVLATVAGWSLLHRSPVRASGNDARLDHPVIRGSEAGSHASRPAPPNPALADHSSPSAAGGSPSPTAAQRCGACPEEEALLAAKSLLAQLASYSDSTSESDSDSIIALLLDLAARWPSVARAIAVELQHQQQEQVRLKLIRALGRSRDTSVVACLSECALLDRTLAVRLAALNSLTEPDLHGAFRLDVVVPLERFVRVATLDTEEPSMRERILRALRGSLREERLAVPIQSLLRPGIDREVRLAAIDALSIDANIETTDILFHMARSDDDARVRLVALIAVRIPEGDPRVVPLYTTTLSESRDEEARQWAALLLGTTQAQGGSDVAAASQVVSALCAACTSDQSPRVRAAAVCALGDSTDPRAFQQVVSTIQSDPEGIVRASALDALVRLAEKIPSGREHVNDVLRGAVNDSDPEVSKSASDLLEKERARVSPR